MKILTYVEFRYVLYIDLKTAQALSKVAVKHYDSVCRRAAGPFSDELAFITYWIETLKRDAEIGEELGVYTKWREIDTCLKILEQAKFQMVIKTITPQEYALLEALQITFHKVLNKSNQCWKHWDKEINAETEYSGKWED